MLLIPTFRAPSSIHGQGLFAAAPVLEGTRVWEFTEGFDQVILPEQLDRLPAAARDQFFEYSYLDKVHREYVLCADDARFMNHSETPTLRDIPGVGQDRYGYSIAAHDLRVGEELTCDYREFELDEESIDYESQTSASRRRPGEMSYVAPEVVVREQPCKGGSGLFARAPIARGSVLVVWGGEAVTLQELMTYNDRDRRYSVQIDDNIFLSGAGLAVEPADFLNHSCSPNAGLRGQLTVVAMRDISAGEEVCFDYAMTDSAAYDEFNCDCGSDRCRKRITANDWRIHELQAEYSGYFSTYLQRRIFEAQRSSPCDSRPIELNRLQGQQG